MRTRILISFCICTLLRTLNCFHSWMSSFTSVFLVFLLKCFELTCCSKDIANFHRPKALWYPHDNELAIKQQGKLPTRGAMKIVVKSLGGKGSKLHVGIEESVSSLKTKASRKLGCYSFTFLFTAL